MRGIAIISLLAVCAGCFGLRDDLVTATDVDGSSDHRVFRIGGLTQVMMEPVFWRLEDRKIVDFDRPVTEFLKDDLPPEFASVTLRMLHDGTSGMPREFLDPYKLGDVWNAASFLFAGMNPYDGMDRRADFLDRLWTPGVRHAVSRRRPGRSDPGYALLLMAICDRLGKTADELCQEHLIEPYGLKDTGFVATQSMRMRLTESCAGAIPYCLPRGVTIDDRRGTGEVSLYAFGMLSSPSDVLRVCYVIKPLLDRAKGVLDARRCSDGRTVWCRSGTVLGGNYFAGFDPDHSRVVVILGNETGQRLKRGLELMDDLAHPPEGT